MKQAYNFSFKQVSLLDREAHKTLGSNPSPITYYLWVNLETVVALIQIFLSMAIEQMGMRTVKASYERCYWVCALEKQGHGHININNKRADESMGKLYKNGENCFSLYKKKAAKELRKSKKMKGSKNTGLDEVKKQL